MFAMKFLSIGCLVQKKKFKIDFQHGGEGDCLGFPSGTIVAVFDTQVNLVPVLPSKFRVMWSFHSGEKFKIDCQDSGCGGHLGFPTRIILAIFDHPDTSYQVTSPLAFWLKK